MFGAETPVSRALRRPLRLPRSTGQNEAFPEKQKVNRELYEKAQNRLEEVTRRLKHDPLSTEERAELEREGRELARVIMSPWVPFDWRYRVVMLIIAALGLWGLIEGYYFLMSVWLLLLIFSPRVVGKCLYALGGLKEEERSRG